MAVNSTWMDPLAGTGSVASPRRRGTSKRPRLERFVLKLNGRIVSDRKLQLRAARWAADDLRNLGLGGGIVDLLIPRTVRQQKQLETDQRKYTLARVRTRDKGRRGAMRDAATSPELLLQLLGMYPLHKASKVAFGTWIFDQLHIKNSKVRLLIALHAPELIEDPRSINWWKRIQVQKMSR